MVFDVRDTQAAPGSPKLVIPTPPARRPQMTIVPLARDALMRVVTGLHEYTIVSAVDTPNSLRARLAS